MRWSYLGCAAATALVSIGGMQAGRAHHSVAAGFDLDSEISVTGTIQSMKADGESLAITVGVGPDLSKYIVEKGYIAVDGTSLTVTEVTDTSFSFMLVKYTQGKVVQAKKKPGDRVNIEVDLLAKYVERFVLKMNSKL